MAQPLPYEWQLGHPYTSKVDAAFPLNQNYVGIISGRNIHFEPMVRSFDILPTDAILDANLFPAQYSTLPVSDVISVNDTVALFFKGTVYVPVHKYTLQPLGNASTWTGLPAMWENQIDAALEWTRGSYCFIRGLQYVLYDPFRRTYAAPQLLNRLAGWPTTWTGNIDAAFNGGDGYLYFIRKGLILAYDAQMLSPAPGEPASLAGQNLNAVVVQTANNGQGGGTDPNARGTGGGGAAAVPGADPNNPYPFDPNKEWCAISKIEDYTNMKFHNSEQPSREFGKVPGGTRFKDVLPSDSRIAELRVWGDGPITAIQLVCVSKEGDVTESDVHGEAWGQPEKFILRQDECVNQISGTYGGPAGDYIYTLQFTTNKRKSPIFGQFNGKKGINPFEIKVNLEDAMSGLTGTYSKYLHFIGMEYRAFSLMTLDANGRPQEFLPSDTLLNGVKEDDKPKDPWIDNHKEDANRVVTAAVHDMPMYQWLLKSVNITTVDPFKADEGKFPNNAVSVRISSKLGGTKNTWYMPYGYSSQSTTAQTTYSSESVETYSSFSQFSNSNAFNVSGGFEVPMVVAGSANYSQKISPRLP